MTDYRVCAHCIMDTTDPDIRFDGTGVCNHCRAYAAKAKSLVYAGRRGDEKLASIVARIKREGVGREYDCIVGVSGGVDSTFTAYTVKQLGLRPLAVHVDNGWDSELSVRNIERAMRKLDVDLYTHVLDWEEFRDVQLSFIKASVLNWEIPTDHAYHGALFRVAAAHNARFIIHGGNVVTEAILPFKWGYVNKDFRLIKGIHKRFGTKKLKSFPRLSLSLYLYYLLLPRVRYVYLLNYIAYNKQQAIELLQRELGWEYYGGKHYESIYTRFYQGYVLPTKFGIDKRKAHLSTLICSGQITRNAAVEEMRREPYPKERLAEDKAYVLKKLGVSEEEFEGLMALPQRSERDYPSHYRFFQAFRLFKGYVNAFTRLKDDFALRVRSIGL
jgi:N-acetyl sugar amidotransferase